MTSEVLRPAGCLGSGTWRRGVDADPFRPESSEELLLLASEEDLHLLHRLDIVRPFRDRDASLKGRNGFISSSCVAEGLPEIAIGGRVVLLEFDGPPVGARRILVTGHLGVFQTDQVVSERVLRIVLHRLQQNLKALLGRRHVPSIVRYP